MPAARNGRVHFHANIKMIEIPIYDQLLFVLPGSAYLADVYRQMGIDGADGPFSLGSAERFRLHSGDVLYAICVDSKAIDVIVHECYHIVSYLFDDLGIVTDVDNDEPGAYLIGWMTREVVAALKKAKIVPFGKPLPPEQPEEKDEHQQQP